MFLYNFRETLYDHIFDLLRFFVLLFWPRWICCFFFWWPEVLIFNWNNYLAGVLKFHKGGKILMTSFFLLFSAQQSAVIWMKNSQVMNVSRGKFCRIAYSWTSSKHFCDNVEVNDGNYFRWNGLSWRKSRFKSQKQQSLRKKFIQTLLSIKTSQGLTATASMIRKVILIKKL